MSVNASPVSAGNALATLLEAWSAQSRGDLTASWMLHGKPGVGKSQIVQQLADRIGAKLFDLRLTTIEPQDLRGLPYYDHDQKRTVWYRPEDLPNSPDEPSVLFLDELTAAAPTLQPTVYGLLQERRVGRHVLPDSVFIVAAGNTVDDGAIAYDMGTALSDRLIHLEIQASAKDWLENYAVNRSLHPAVTAFLRARPDLLETTETALRKGETIACTPRSWERVSDILNAVPDRRVRNVMIAGTIGQSAASEFGPVVDEIAANTSVADLIVLPRNKRPDAYPKTLNGLVALIYASIALADKETLQSIIEVIADIRRLSGDQHAGMPLSELTTFGFELLISKALDTELEEAFAQSQVYAEYAAEREATGVVY
ncbi:MAG: AAA family ATPase [Rhodobacteraceae bacterium]|nr:AAA family ATPase [Paracoccaceae bacterium]